MLKGSEGVKATNSYSQNSLYSFCVFVFGMEELKIELIHKSSNLRTDRTIRTISYVQGLIVR